MLVCGVISGVRERCMRARANAPGVVRRNWPACLVTKGMSTLHLAAMRCDEDESETTRVESIIKALLARGAELAHVDRGAHELAHAAAVQAAARLVARVGAGPAPDVQAARGGRAAAHAGHGFRPAAARPAPA